MITKETNTKNPLWYKDAVIYQLHVRAFHDSNSDGIGDFRGLTQKLDYLSDLGVSAVWLLPFYPSPLRDDGYDIANYTDINSAYGNMEDFQDFLDQAHRRNLRVITELVINHTSDQHEWFQKSRRASKDSFWRNFYVWSDDPEKYKGTRIIFKDFETSNWTWDPVAKSYYWHRFYSHQPDLNFDNPDVQKAIYDALDFWMQKGVDGLRLDAVPYLFERENTSCENLPETHKFLKKLRAYLEEKYPGTMLLAEANQWPEDAVAYFGEGDECHMNFHFPLMPRLFMALKMEDRYSIIDILKQTPEIPDNCQWAIFLRNHDELTLEMVTDEERDYMYKVYANDPRARINLGVRHRLSPLVGGDRKQIELLNALLFSLPGSPIIYYGDEIGMGDNIYLGDRDGVRTPFQWSLDRNAGFSEAHPQKLYLPVISSPEYPIESINVEMQKNNSNSLLWWMVKMINLRSSLPALGRGKLEFITSSNPKILTYVRTLGEDSIICVVNLSRNSQFTEMDLTQFKGRIPTEILGQTEFPKITENPYVITLAPYAYYWLKVSEIGIQNSDIESFEIEIEEYPMEALERRRVWRAMADALKIYLPKQRWFGSKGRTITTVEKYYSLSVPMTSDKSGELLILKVHYTEGLADHYLMGLAHRTNNDILTPEFQKGVVAKTSGVAKGYYVDAFLDKDFCTALANLILKGSSRKGDHVYFSTEYIGDSIAELANPSFCSGEQSNSAIIFTEGVFLKFYRHLDNGENPEIEMGKFFREKDYQGTAAYVGSLSFEREQEKFSLAIMQKSLQKENDAWTLIVDQLAQVIERVTLEQGKEISFEVPQVSLKRVRDMRPPEEFKHIAGYTLTLISELGSETAKMHMALGGDTEKFNFRKEYYTPFLQRSFFQSLRNLTDKSLNQIRAGISKLSPEDRKLAEKCLAKEEDLYQRLNYVRTTPLESMRIRVHGDYHLGQVVHTGERFYIVDFEGEPARSLGERKLKSSPLKDVAGMLRSFDYATEFQLRKSVIRDQDRERVEASLKAWAFWARSEYLNAYLDAMKDSNLLPLDTDQFENLLDIFVLEKALYEIAYEIQNRPDWVSIPLRGLLQVLERQSNV